MCGTNMEDKPPHTLPEGTERINTGTTGTTSSCLHLKLSTVSLTQCSAACDIQDAKPCCWFATTAPRPVWTRGASQRLTRTVTASGPLGPPPVPVPRPFWLARSAHSKQLSNPWLSRADNMHQIKLFFGFGWTSSKIQATLRARESKRERDPLTNKGGGFLTGGGGGQNKKNLQQMACCICEIHPKYLTIMTISREQVNIQSANESLFNKQVENTCMHAHNAHTHERSVIMMFFVEFLG